MHASRSVVVIISLIHSTYDDKRQPGVLRRFFHRVNVTGEKGPLSVKSVVGLFPSPRCQAIQPWRQWTGETNLIRCHREYRQA
jgi:hypothetical protein